MIDDVYQLAFGTIRNHLRQAGVAFTEEDGDFVIGGHRLGLSIVFDGFTRQAAESIAPIEIQIRLDGDEGDRFRIGAIGVGNTQDEAIRSAISEWHVLAAAPVLASLGAEIGTLACRKAGMILAGWQLFPGRAGLRGGVPPALHSGGTFYSALLMALAAEIARWDTPRDFSLRSIFVMASGEAAAANSGEAKPAVEIQAAVDGFVSPPLTEKISALSWPAATGAFFYKQLFVLRHDG